MEEKVISTIDNHSEAILGMLIDKPGQLIGMMKALNGAKRRSAGEATQPHASATQVVPVQLPAFIVQAAVPQVQHNADNEVISVDNRDLVSLSGTGLKSQLKQEKQKLLPADTAELLNSLDLRG
jgi:hypothetical protein